MLESYPSFITLNCVLDLCTRKLFLKKVFSKRLSELSSFQNRKHGSQLQNNGNLPTSSLIFATESYNIKYINSLMLVGRNFERVRKLGVVIVKSGRGLCEVWTYNNSLKSQLSQITLHFIILPLVIPIWFLLETYIKQVYNPRMLLSKWRVNNWELNNNWEFDIPGCPSGHLLKPPMAGACVEIKNSRLLPKLTKL